MRPTLSHFRSILYLFTASMFFASCAVDPPMVNDDSFRGEIISSTLLHDWSITQTDSALSDYDPSLLTYPNDYNIKIYRVVYRTIDAAGNETQASGAVVIPYGVANGAAQCLYMHGTVVERFEVPSYESDELVLGMLYGANGFVTSLPDYLGMGDSPGRHPYCHSATEASAGIDLLRATKTLCANEGVSLNNQLFIFGYSQGGHAAMAATKAIQEDYADEFTITASAPMSGPYDLSGAQTDYVLQDAPYGAPFYLPYLMFGYNDIYKMYDNYADYLASPYDTLLPSLFDGTHSGWEIDAVMPVIPKNIIKPEVLEDFINNPNNPFRVALRENDLTDWTPQIPMIMYYCGGDELVNYQNSIIAQDAFVANGSTTTSLYQPSATASHTDCAEPCFIFANIWFSSLRQ
ncbi:MAG TPA: lipase family protein [Chitinophagales bacterium]|nr:lipase family protein [Chitinophagales bacterium]HMZ88651.1 lipase family protein [Chitinophagales bacterium]HNK97141.1 lipase family protein [Chitinophagales bacterium]HNM08527.1 lipase family protein [Chitinophagales bacterium]HNM29248.1 lipase family protein [Chitinophagales bacterium]